MGSNMTKRNATPSVNNSVTRVAYFAMQWCNNSGKYLYGGAHQWFEVGIVDMYGK